METNKSKSIKKRYRSAKYKIGLVMELLRGEPMEHLARRENVTLSELTSWKQTFEEFGKSGFSTQSKRLEKSLESARQLIADQAMEIALYKKKLQLLNITLDT